ncbi:hypothetical protein ACFLTK_01910 [Chloroflexota bacterium]
MTNKLLIGIIVVIVGLVITTAILVNIPWATTIIEVALVGVWIYLVRIVRKKKTSLFHDQELKLAERRYKRLKISLLVGGISLVVGIIGVIGHNAIYGLFKIEEPVFFFIAILAIGVFFIATIGGLVIFLKGRRKTS